MKSSGGDTPAGLIINLGTRVNYIMSFYRIFDSIPASYMHATPAEGPSPPSTSLSPHSGNLPLTDLVPPIPDLKLHRTIPKPVHIIPQGADRRAHHPIRLLMVIGIAGPEADPAGKVVFVAARGDDAVAVQADDGGDLHGRHGEGVLDGGAHAEARAGGDGEEDGDVGVRAGRAPEDLLWVAPGESAAVGGEAASVEETAVG